MLLVVLAALAGPVVAEEAAPLIVRKDSLQPGHFFVGVTPAAGEKEPIVVEITPEGAAEPRRYRSPEKRGFDLCSMLRSAGLGARPGKLQIAVSRGASSFRFRIAYDGAMCASAAAPAPSIAGGGVKLKPLNLLGDETPAPAPTAAESVAAAATATPVASTTAAADVPSRPPQTPVTVAVASEPTPFAPAPDVRPEPTRAPAATAAARTPAPIATAATPAPRATTVLPAPAPARPTAVAASAPATPAATGLAEVTLSARERGLTPDNFDSLQVFLDIDKKSGTREYRFVLRFKRPINAEGIEECVVLSAKAVRGAPREFLPRGDTELLDPPADPRSTTFLSFPVNASLALEEPGVNHLVYLKVQIGNLPEAVFEGRTGVQAGKRVKG